MLGPHCTKNPPTLSSTCGAGHVEEFAGLQTYITGDQDSKLAIILLADAYGFEAPNLRKLADKVGDSGYFVVVPDFYYGDPITPEKPGFSAESWLKAHNPDKGCEDAKAVVEALKSKGVSKVGAAGFCWGGIAVARLAKFDCIQAAVLLHPGPVTVEEINEVKIPIAILGAEFDSLAPAEHVIKLGEILSEKAEVDSFVKIFPGVGHGWTVRYSDDDEFAVKSAQESHVDIQICFQFLQKKMLGPHCTKNPPTLSSTCGAGHVEEFAGLQTYITGDQDSKLAIILLAEAFGFEVPNLRKLADKVGDSGYFVVVPDFYYGDPITPEKPGFSIESWLKAHDSDKGCEDAKAVVAALKSKGVTKVGAAGFCWGGTTVARLAKFDCIQAAVLLHPGLVTVEEINEVKIPIAILGAEIDSYTLAEHIIKLGEILSEKAEVDSFVKIFPGVGHGWTLRYSDDDEFAVKSAQESHVDMLNWFAKHIMN
ncbi:hypothetical protein ACJIZ3_013986 [Penstemon smallii]|uniref:Dienelactone hydrolase domain-containing protein n=1 Tax=Penstemon smallii TaxID=265156 RepID=A0ABD3RIA2_9LAMI